MNYKGLTTILENIITEIEIKKDNELESFLKVLKLYHKNRDNIMSLFLNDQISKTIEMCDDIIMDSVISSIDLDDGITALELLDSVPRPLIMIEDFIPPFDFTKDIVNNLSFKINEMVLNEVRKTYTSEKQANETISKMFFKCMLSNICTILEMMEDKKGVSVFLNNNKFIPIIYEMFEGDVDISCYDISINNESLNNIEEQSLESKPLTKMLEDDGFNIDTILGNDRLYRKDET